MTKDEYLDFCREIPGASVDQPFEGEFDIYIARHAAGGKWFAAVMLHGGRWIVNLKCEPVEAEFLRSVFQGVTPGYHMNKTHWNSVYFDSDVQDSLIKRMTIDSFRLTERKKRKPEKTKEAQNNG